MMLEADGASVSANGTELVSGSVDRATILRTMSGIFYCGDNLEILGELGLVPPESVDLIYLDPPFNSQRTYNIVYKGSNAQAEAFKDHWSWEEAAPSYSAILDSPDTPTKLRTLLRGLHDLLIDDDADLLAYLSMMAPRLVILHRMLKQTGCLYLHCDPTASHLLRAILSALFGSENFQNEIVWKRFSSKNDPKRYGRVHDNILFFTNGDEFTWNPQRAPVEEYSINKNFTADDDGRRYTLVDLTANKPGGDTDYEWHGVRPYNGRHWAYSRAKMDEMFDAGLIVFRRTGMPRLKRYLDEQPGVPLQDVWTDIKLATASKERIGYPTQKPVALLERILLSSTKPGDLVLDPFCGCGTTIEACARQGRRWIGIDIATKAVEIAEQRFEKLGLDPPTVEWYPPDIDAARMLAKRDRTGLRFEEWVRRKIRAVRRRKKDRGIDGEAYFRDSENHITHVLVSVKGGKLTPAMVRELRGTVERERAPIGVLVTAKKPSKEMRLEATRAGYLSVSDAEGQIPKLQLVTIDRLFTELPAIRAPGVNVTEMPKAVVPTGEPQQLSLGLESSRPPAKAKRRPTKSPTKARTGSEGAARPKEEERAKQNRKRSASK